MTTDVVIAQTLEAVERGSIAPDTYRVLLSATSSPSAISQGLQQTFSVYIRQHCIKSLGKALRSKSWKEAWDGVGGTLGLLDTFAKLSVHDVRDACKALRRAGKGEELDEKRRCVTELFVGLQPAVYPEATFRSTDKRPLALCYQDLIPSCTKELVERVLDADPKVELKPGIYNYLVQYHTELMRVRKRQALTKHKDLFKEKESENLFTQYPQEVSRNTPELSASMEFSLDTLRTIVESNASKAEHSLLLDQIVRPLLRRAVKKKVGWLQIQEIVDLSMSYLKQHPQAGKSISLARGDLTHLVARCWTQKPVIFEYHLKTLCSHTDFGIPQHSQLTKWENFLIDIPHDQRYTLLQLCFKAATGRDISVEKDLEKIKGNLSDTLLERLQPHEALKLYKLWREAKGNKASVATRNYSTFLQAPTFSGISGIDLDLYEVCLLFRNNDVEAARELALTRIEERKEKARTAAAPEQRAFYAKSVTFYAMASGDLQILRDVLQWTQRFLRDHVAFRELHPDHYPQEMIAILSGVPENLNGYSASEVRTRVIAGNAALKGMFDEACAAIREQTFHAHRWQGTLEIFSCVVRERVSRAKRLRNALSLSDDEMYDTLWDDTLKMLLDVERKTNLRANKALNADLVRGMLAYERQYIVVIKDPQLSTCKFFDNLARARDEFWQGVRAEHYPALATLPKPFPRGLPIQHLIHPFHLDFDDMETHAPYLASRINAVLFPEPVNALLPMPDDKESKAAIGIFVDSYRTALQFYMHSSFNLPEQAERYRKVWEYAVGPLSQDRMNREESLRFWKRISDWHRYDPDWSREWHEKLYPADKSTWPKIPEVEDPAQAHIWNPFDESSGRRPGQEAREVGAPTYLDASLVIHTKTHAPIKLRSAISGTLEKPSVPEYGDSTRAIWYTRRDSGEGSVLSALLHLEKLHGASNGRLLEKPFPSADDLRYPVLELAPEFYEILKKHQMEGTAYVDSDNAMSFPPALLHLSVKNVVDHLRSLDGAKSALATYDHQAFGMISCLMWSDRPALAKEMVLSAVLERPDASSWHRLLLAPGFLKRLQPKDAKWCIDTFANAVFEKMKKNKDKKQPTGNDQSSGKEATKDLSKKDESTKSYIKITTIKLLAQLLQSTGIIDDDIAFSMLSTLGMTASHVDVQLQTVKSLLKRFSTCPPDSVENVISALETVIPLAGNLNERKPVTEDDWILAEQTLSPPKYPDIDDTAPIRDTLMEHYKRKAIDAERLKLFINRILLPTIDHLKQQTARWLRIFLRKRGVGDDVQVPAIPHRSGRITTLLDADANTACYIPRTLLDDLMTYLTFKLVPPEAITSLNKTLLADKKILLQPDVQTWFGLYRPSIDAVINLGQDLLNLFDKPTKLDDGVGIDSEVIQEHFLAVFKISVQIDAPFYKNLSNHLLAPLLNGSCMMKLWWSTHGISILKAAIGHVEALRTVDWERDEKRRPVVLPDTFPWRLMGLDFPLPSKDSTDGDIEEQCKAFAQQLSEVVEETVRGTKLYHGKINHLKAYLHLDPTTNSTSKSSSHRLNIGQIRLFTALHLGAIDTGTTRLRFLTAADVFRVELAAGLLSMVVGGKGWESKGKMEERVKKMVEGWKGCDVEEVRRLGWRAGEGMGKGKG